MWILIITVFVLVLLVITVLFSKINMDIRLSKQGKNDEVVFNITMLYGLIRYNYELPVLKFDNVKKGLIVKVEKNKNIVMGTPRTQDSETQVDKRKIDFWMREIHEVLAATESFKSWMKRTLSRLSIVKLTWSTYFSVGDAASTATATGIIWSAKTFIIGFLSYQVRMRNNPQLVVVPIFEDRTQFSTEIYCTAHISLGYAVYAGVVLMVRVLKVKGGVKKLKSVLFKR